MSRIEEEMLGKCANEVFDIESIKKIIRITEQKATQHERERCSKIIKNYFEKHFIEGKEDKAYKDLIKKV